VTWCRKPDFQTLPRATANVPPAPRPLWVCQRPVPSGLDLVLCVSNFLLPDTDSRDAADPSRGRGAWPCSVLLLVVRTTCFALELTFLHSGAVSVSTYSYICCKTISFARHVRGTAVPCSEQTPICAEKAHRLRFPPGAAHAAHATLPLQLPTPRWKRPIAFASHRGLPTLPTRPPHRLPTRDIRYIRCIRYTARETGTRTAVGADINRERGARVLPLVVHQNTSDLSDADSRDGSGTRPRTGLPPLL
jgi:hypothetical protein